MYKSLSILFFLSLCFSFEVEEKLSITELKEEAELFILNQSYIDAISNYEKIYDIQSLIFGLEHKNLAETLIVLGDLYYKIGDEVNSLRCFQESIRIMHYNMLLSNQSLITPFEYLFEIYLNNDQPDIAKNISDQLSYLYSLDTLSYINTKWMGALNYNFSSLELVDSILFLQDSTQFVDPYDYIENAKIHIQNSQYYQATEVLSNAFIEGYDIFNYEFYNELFNNFSDEELNQLADFFQTLKYSDSQDIQSSTYFYLAIISLSNNIMLYYLEFYYNSQNYNIYSLLILLYIN